MRGFVIGLVLLLMLSSCRQKVNDSDNKAVARIYDKTLYQSDLQNVLYEGISASDSIVATKAFIDNWIRRQLVIHQAENDIAKAELDFSKEMEEYRNSLIIYKYETYIIEKNLDTVVSDIEIENYAKANDLPDDIGKEAIRYIIVNMRKKSLIDKTKNNLYNKAVKDRVFEIY